MDPFSHPSLSPADFYHGGPSPQGELAPGQPGSSQQQLQPGGGGGGPGPGPGPRNYKSRKYRPCDFCRARQVACKIEVAPPCQLCQSHRRECTFVEQPKKKRRPPAENAGGAATAGAAGVASGSSQGPVSRAATATPSAVGGRLHIGMSHLITSQRRIRGARRPRGTCRGAISDLPCPRSSSTPHARASAERQ
jgi:hypothetical protein